MKIKADKMCELEKFGFIPSKTLVRPFNFTALHYEGWYKPYGTEQDLFTYIDSNGTIIPGVWDMKTLQDLITAGMVEL